MTAYNKKALSVNLINKVEKVAVGNLDAVISKSGNFTLSDQLETELEAFKASDLLIGETPIESKHQITKILVKRLFTCRKCSEVDVLIQYANAATKKYSAKYPQGDERNSPVDFAVRIRNAEMQVRDLIKTKKMVEFNPYVSAIIVTNGSGEALADSWGHLAHYLLRGYKVQA